MYVLRNADHTVGTRAEQAATAHGTHCSVGHHVNQVSRATKQWSKELAGGRQLWVRGARQNRLAGDKLHQVRSKRFRAELRCALNAGGSWQNSTLSTSMPDDAASWAAQWPHELMKVRYVPNITAVDNVLAIWCVHGLP